MTTVGMMSKRCAVCEAEAEYRGVYSCSTGGCMMDTRPIFLGDDPMRYIDRCKCGYVASDISEETTVTKKDLEMPEYQRSIMDDTLANRYVAIAFLRSLKGMHKQSAYAYLRAAWMADDEKDGAVAADMRREFLEEISKVKCKVEDVMVKADVLRRLVMFEQAEEAVSLAQTMSKDKTLVYVMKKEKELILAENTHREVC